jgi:hypothetical protein
VKKEGRNKFDRRITFLMELEPENIRFGGGSELTILHPFVAVAMVIAIVLILCLSRKSAIWPLLLALFLIPKGQVIVVAGIHLNVYRLIILAGLARWIVSRRSSPKVDGSRFLDHVCIALFLSVFVVNSLLYGLQGQAVIKNIGDLLDALGGYTVIRFLIRDRDDARQAIKALVTIAIVNAVCMLNEQRTGANIFGLLGGVAMETVRDGKVRSQGSFEVFITAGTYGATLVPLVIWLWSQAKSKTISAVGIVASVIMAFTCYASTTLVACLAGIFALCLWPIRRQMRPVRWVIAILLVGLHLIMNGPVWSLLEKVDLTGSSSSFHRYQLIDNFFRHFGDWWLLGTTQNPYWGWMMWDLSDQYVAYAFTGGLLAFVLFVGVISIAFSRLGTARNIADGDRDKEWFLWCLGAAVFSHVISFFGIDYMDQMQYAWFVLLAIIPVAVLDVEGLAAPEVQESTAPSYECFSAH